MNVPFLDVGAAYRELAPAIDEAVRRVLESGWYLRGDETEAFEAEFAAYAGAKHCVAVGNGLDALHLSLRAAGIGEGDEVLVPSNTYVATWLAVTYAGATPVPVEPDPATYQMDPAAAAAAVTARTAAVVPVHLYGTPAPLPEIAALARRHHLFLLADAAQAHGARLGGKPLGGFGSAAAWSFYPGKNLGALGDAGAVTTDDPAFAERVRMLGNYGSVRKYEHLARGYNSRTDEIQAAVLRVKLGVLDEWNDRRRAHAAAYTEALRDSGLGLPSVPDGADPAWHLYVVRAPERDRLVAALAARGVHAQVHYPTPPHLQPAYADLGLGAGALPVSEAIHGEVLSLPIGPHLTDEQREHVVAETIGLLGRSSGGGDA